jgi:hypothetical protein
MYKMSLKHLVVPEKKNTRIYAKGTKEPPGSSSSVPKWKILGLGMATHTCNHSYLEMEMGRIAVQGQSWKKVVRPLSQTTSWTWRCAPLVCVVGIDRKILV